MLKSVLPAKISTLLQAALVVIALAATISRSHATELTFDSLSSSENLVPNGYGGFNWSDFYVDGGLGGGYTSGIVSDPNAIFNGFGTPASFSSATPFTFNSADLTAAFSPENVTVTGYNASGVQIYDQVVAITGTPMDVNFDFTDVSKVEFTTNGGGTQVVLDNIFVNDAVASAPDSASTMALMGLGLGALALAASRRSKKA